MKKVEWAQMSYIQAVDAGLIDKVKAHVLNLPEPKREDYIKYLTTMCNFPSTLF